MSRSFINCAPNGIIPLFPNQLKATHTTVDALRYKRLSGQSIVSAWSIRKIALVQQMQTKSNNFSCNPKMWDLDQ